MKVESTKPTNPEWETLQSKCNEMGVTIAEYMRDIIRKDFEYTSSGTAADDKKKPTDSQLKKLISSVSKSASVRYTLCAHHLLLS